MEKPRNENRRLERLIGEWSMAMIPADQKRPDRLPDIGARVRFEWIGEKAFVVQRWSVPVPEAPDGIAVIRWDDGRGRFLQHYFDTRGVARIYEMSLDSGVWTLERTKPDLSPLEFSQRFTGTFSDDGNRIDGTWEIARESWQKDFDLVYTRV